MTPERPESDRGRESDQRPEEAPPEQIVDDSSGGAREDANENAGGAGDEDRATGHPDER